MNEKNVGIPVFTTHVKNHIKEIKFMKYHKPRKKKYCFLCRSQGNSLLLILGVYFLLFSIALIILVISMIKLQNADETGQKSKFLLNESNHNNRGDYENFSESKKINSLFYERLYKEFKWPFQSLDFNCSNLNSVKKFEYLTSGWTKNVYSFEYEGKKYALKAVNLNGVDMQNCMKNHSMRACFEKTSLKLFKEYIFSKELNHRTIIKVLAWCASSSVFSNDIAIITELCTPVDVVSLLRLPFSQRLKIMVDLSELMMYLEHSPLGSIAINDFQRQQFVLCGNTLKLTDLDDLSIEEPKCNTPAQCNYNYNKFGAFNLNGSQNVVLKCIDNTCLGYNAKQNVMNTYTHFVNLFLNITTPTALKNEIENLFHKYTTTWNTGIVFKATENLYAKYKQLNSNIKIKVTL